MELRPATKLFQEAVWVEKPTEGRYTVKHQQINGKVETIAECFNPVHAHHLRHLFKEIYDLPTNRLESRDYLYQEAIKEYNTRRKLGWPVDKHALKLLKGEARC